MRRKITVLAAIWVAAMLASVSFAGVKKAEAFLVFVQERNFIETICSHGLAPEALSKRQMYLIVRAGAAYAQVIACADPTSDAKALAESLAKSGLSDDVKYSQENDFAVAEIDLSSGKLFATEKAWDFDLGKLVRGLRDDGWQVFGGVRVPKDAEGAITATPAFAAKGYDIYPLDKLTADPVHLEAHLGLFVVFLAFLIAVGPILAATAGLVAATVIAGKKEMAVERRRKLVARLKRYSFIGVVGSCFPLLLTSLYTGVLTPVADLWFGSRDVFISLLPFMLALTPLPIVAIFPMTKAETRLLSDSPDKVGFQEAKAVSISKGSKTPLMAVALTLIIVGGGLTLYAMSIKRNAGLKGICTFVGYAIMFSAAPLAGRVFARANFSKLKEQTDNPLVTRVVAIATEANCEVGSVDVIEPRDQAQTVEMSFSNGRLSITRRAIDELSDKAFDFGVAYALSAKPYRVLLPIFAFVVPVAGLQAFLLMPWLRDHLPRSQIGISSFLGMVPMFIPMFFFMNWLTAREAKRQIRAALKVIPDRVAALECLHRTVQSGQGVISPERMAKAKVRTLRYFDQVCSELGPN